MSSVEPNDRSGEIDGGEEVASGLVVPCGDASPLLQADVAAFDDVAPLVGLRVERRGPATPASLGLAPRDLVGSLWDRVRDLAAPPVECWAGSVTEHFSYDPEQGFYDEALLMDGAADTLGGGRGQR